MYCTALRCAALRTSQAMPTQHARPPPALTSSLGPPRVQTTRAPPGPHRSTKHASASVARAPWRPLRAPSAGKAGQSKKEFPCAAGQALTLGLARVSPRVRPVRGARPHPASDHSACATPCVHVGAAWGWRGEGCDALRYSGGPGQAVALGGSIASNGAVSVRWFG